MTFLTANGGPAWRWCGPQALLRCAGESCAMGGGKSKPQTPPPPAPAEGPHHARVGSTSAAARAPAVGGSTDRPAQTSAQTSEQPASEKTLLACLPPAKSHDVETRHKAPVQNDINCAAAVREMSGLQRESSLSSEAVSPHARKSVTSQLPKSAQMHLVHKIKSDHNRSLGRQTEADKRFLEGERALTDMMKGKRHQQVKKIQEHGIDELLDELKNFKSKLGNSSGQATTQLLRYVWRAHVCVSCWDVAAGAREHARMYVHVCACAIVVRIYRCQSGTCCRCSHMRIKGIIIIDLARCPRSPERTLRMAKERPLAPTGIHARARTSCHMRTKRGWFCQVTNFTLFFVFLPQD